MFYGFGYELDNTYQRADGPEALLSRTFGPSEGNSIHWFSQVILKIPMPVAKLSYQPEAAKVAEEKPSTFRWASEYLIVINGFQLFRAGRMSDYLRVGARKLPVYPFVRSLYRRFRRPAVRHPLQNLKAKKGYPLKRLGTDYGGWTFVDDPSLFGATVISAGLGEDASFDIEFCRHYRARVIIVDPTPRAIAHFGDMTANFGNGKVRKYVSGGKQPIGAYDLTGLSSVDFELIPKALWESSTTLKFFEPNNPHHVSHSIVNFQHDYVQDTRHIEVESITMTELLEGLGLESEVLQLLKLDIEGAEIEVISDLLDKGVRPKQILVEFDELNVPSPKSFERIDFINAKLESHDYVCVWTDGQADFLYVLK